MRKHVVNTVRRLAAADARREQWLDLERLARVQVTSEEDGHPVEAALLAEREAGWRAAEPGEQTIRLIFDEPQRVRRILLHFVESETERTQEFVVRWSPDGGQSFREIVRQQWNFSPSGATEEIEDYQVELAAVTVLELTIVPDPSGGPAHASLARCRLA